MKLDFTINGLMQLVHPDELNGAMSAVADSLTRCATTCNLEHAQKAAACWALAVLPGMGVHQSNGHVNTEDLKQLLRMALIKRTIYELGITSEYKQEFSHEKADAGVLMEAVRRFTQPVYEA